MGEKRGIKGKKAPRMSTYTLTFPTKIWQGAKILCVVRENMNLRKLFRLLLQKEVEQAIKTKEIPPEMAKELEIP